MNLVLLKLAVCMKMHLLYFMMKLGEDLISFCNVKTEFVLLCVQIRAAINCNLYALGMMEGSQALSLY